MVTRVGFGTPVTLSYLAPYQAPLDVFVAIFHAKSLLLATISYSGHMRSSDARWHLAVEALARMPELAHRLVEVHQADEKGYCRGCMAPGGTLFVRWPCGLHRLASASTDPGRVAAVQERVADGERLKDAVSVVASAAGVPKRELYAAALAEQRD